MNKKAHSLLGGSSAERWTRCPGSVALVGDGGAADKASAYYGTMVHSLFEQAVLGKPLPKEGDIVPVPDWFEMPSAPFEWEATLPDGTRGLEVTRETLAMLTTALQCVTMWRTRFAGCIDEEHVELRVEIDDASFGTADYVLWANDYSDLVVLDLKTGHKPVASELNPQLLFYAYGVMRASAPRWTADARVRLHIVQPTAQADCATSYWSTTASAVEMWADTVLHPAISRAKEALEAASPTPWLSPGSHCRHCPALSRCPMALAYLLAVVGETPQTDPVELSDEDLSALLFRLNEVKDGYYAARTEAVRRMLEEGREVPGWKLRRTGSPARWADGAEEELVLTFGEQAYERVLLTPAEVVRRFGQTGKKIVEQWTVKAPDGYTVVPADRRKTSAVLAAAAKAIQRAKQIGVDGSNQVE